MARISKIDVNKALTLAAKTIIDAGGTDGTTTRTELKRSLGALNKREAALTDLFFRFIDHRADAVTPKEVNKAVAYAKKQLVAKYDLNADGLSRSEISRMSLTGKLAVDLAKSLKASGASDAQAVDLGDFKPKATWKKLEGAAIDEALSTMAENGIWPTLHAGRSEVSISPEGLEALARAGDLVLFKNPKEERPFDEETGRDLPWEPGFHLVINRAGAFGTVAVGLEDLMTRGRELSERISTSLSSFHDVIHASRVNGLGGPPDMTTIKREVRAAIPPARAALERFDEESKAWAKDAKALTATAPAGAPRAAVKAVLADESVIPKSRRELGIDVQSARDVLIADAAVYARNEVRSVDPGYDAVRVNIDVKTLVAGGGTVEGYEQALQKTLKQAGVASAVDVSFQLDGLKTLDEVVQRVVVPAIGARNLRQLGQSGFGRETTYSLMVRSAAAEQTRALLPEVLAAVRPYGITSVRVQTWDT